MYVAIYMTVIIALCLIVYFTLPETGSRERATVALTDPEVLEGEHVVLATGSAASQSKRSRS
jgi:MHS family alpha-ketoglutarate permease-like MFS transporter